MAETSKTKVMMVDDEKFLLGIYKIHFEKAGFEVATYHDVDNALSALRQGYVPQIILFDITMPDSRSGYEFIEALKKEGLAEKTIKIALTNEGQDGPKDRLIELGADAHLLKASFIPSEIADKVTELLRSRKTSWI